jgi:hypothetical protein
MGIQMNLQIKLIIFLMTIFLSPLAANSFAINLGDIVNHAIKAASSHPSFPPYSSIEYKNKKGVDHHYGQKKKAWKTVIMDDGGYVGKVNLKRYTYGRNTNVLKLRCVLYETGMELDLNRLESPSVTFVEMVLGREWRWL